MFNIIDEFFYDIDKKKDNVNSVNLNLTRDEALEKFLKEVELYLGDYAKERSIKSSEEILYLCSEYEKFLSNEDIFYYYKSFGEYLANDNKNAHLDIIKALELDSNAFEYYILKGKINEKLGNQTEAFESYIKGLELNPKSIEGLKRLGFLHMSNLNFEEGFIYFDRAYSLEKDDHEIYSGLAGCSFELGEVEKALDYITKAIVLEGNNANYYYNRAIINRVLANPKKAIKDYKKTIEIEPTYQIAYFYLADLYIQLKDIEQAKEILEQVLIINDKYADAYIKLSYCYMIENNLEKALDAVTKAINLEPTNAEYYHKRALIYLGMSNQDGALEDYLKIVELDATNPLIFDSIGKLYMEEEKFEKAIEYLSEGLKLEETESFYGNIAICEYHLKNYSKARDNFTKSISLSSQNIAEDYFFRGKCSYYLNDRDRGKSDFEKALDSGEFESTGAMYYLAYIAYSEGDFEKVVDYINKYLTTENDDLMLLRMLSAAYTELSDFESARKVLLKAEKFNQSLPEIYNDIALSYYNEDDISMALSYYDKSIELDDTLCIAYSNRAIARESAGLFDEAIDDYKKAIAINDDISYYFGMANAYEKLGEFDIVDKIYVKLLDDKKDNPIVLGEIAYYYQKKKNYDIALNLYKEALNIDENIYIKSKYIKLLFDMKYYDDGVRAAENFLNMIDDNKEVEDIKYDMLNNLGLIYMKNKDISNAIKCLEKCIDFTNTRDESIKRLIEIYKINNDLVRVQYYEDLLDE